MKQMSRRQALRLFLGGAAAALSPLSLRAQTVAPRVVVVGGGFAGATVAKYLRLWGGNVQVTLVEPNPTHIACIGSNLVLNGMSDLQALTLPYTALQNKYGVNVVQDSAVGIEPINRRVTLGSGATLEYDRLILAPGINFVAPPGWNQEVMPHAWQAGPQTLLLRQQLAAMPSGGVFVMTVPPAPYRCPPGPYERACVVADFVSKNKPGSKVIVLDANPGITAEPQTFSTAFNGLYANVIEYHPNVAVNEADSQSMTLKTNIGDIRGSVVNLIPRQRAGKIVMSSGLVDPGKSWASVDPLTYESRIVPGIHVLGDSQATGQPKSGHMANAQAKVCADAILRAFEGLPPDPYPKTNSACYSPITDRTASWLTVVFGYDSFTQTMKAVPGTLQEAPAPTAENFKQMTAWAANLFADSFK